MLELEMDTAMEDVQPCGGMDPSIVTKEELVLFQLLNETNFSCRSPKYPLLALDIPNSAGIISRKPAFNISVDIHVSVPQPVRLVKFGTDTAKCDMLLSSPFVYPLHCSLWAQLNSGPNVLVISNHSADSLQYWDADAVSKGSFEALAAGCSRSTRHLLGLKVGPYMFSVHYVRDSEQSQLFESWFRKREWTPVTENMLAQQLGNRIPEWETIGIAGEGANGQVTKKMEKHSGLILAFKEFPAETAQQKQIAAQEIKFMKNLRHVSRRNS